ncbi:ArsR family transcriptional regulator [Candidatus Thorarchaeota archaeon]|nr:MAG: ArsR family transcriptional regulator [Candidatus Thorarchaeota archaeon]
MGEAQDEPAMDSELRGNTLRVYWYMLNANEPVGVREVQRALGMSSPSVASHHLSKLVSLDLIEQQSDNTYHIKQIVKVGVLRNFIEFRGRLLPRYTFVAMFFTSYTFAYLFLCIISPPNLFDRYIALAIGILGALFAWWESIRLWKLKLS